MFPRISSKSFRFRTVMFSASKREGSRVPHSVGCSTPPVEGNSDVEVDQLQQRSALSVPPMASQSADPGGDGNQHYPLRSPVPSDCGKANGHHPKREFGSYLVLDDGRSRKQAARFQELLQKPSHAYLASRANAGYVCVTAIADLHSFQWQSHCRGQYQTPMVA